MRNKRKHSTLMVLLILLLTITVGYALLSTTLKINGSATITKNNWSIYWDNVSTAVVTGDAVEDTSARVKTGTTDEVEFEVTLKTPGDAYEFTLDAVNDGSIDAMVDLVSLKVGDNAISTLPSYIKYTVTYLDGTPIRKYHKLAKKNGSTATRETYKVKVEFLDTITTEQYQTLGDSISYDFTFKLTYVQADDYAYDRTYSDLVFTSVPGVTNAPLYIGDTVDTSMYSVTNDYTTLTHGNNLQNPTFLGLKLDNNNVITNGYACVIYNNELVCIEGLSNDTDMFDKNVAKVTEIFGVYDSATDLGCRTEMAGMYNCYIEPGAATSTGNPITYINPSDGQTFAQLPTGESSLVMNTGGRAMLIAANYND